MKVYMVRHGEPSYSPCTKRNLIGQGRDLAALNDVGIDEMDKCGLALKDAGCQVILSSPYTRALQSSAIIARHTGLTTRVVHDLHEWIPDLTYTYQSYAELKSLFEDFKKNRGQRPPESDYTEFTRWEELSSLKERVYEALLPYEDQYQSVIMVVHGMVMQSFHWQDHYLYGEVYAFDFNKDMTMAIWPLESE